MKKPQFETAEARALAWIIQNSTDDTIETFVAEAMRQKKRDLARVILETAERVANAADAQS